MSAMERMAVALAPGVGLEAARIDVLKCFLSLATDLEQTVYDRCAREYVIRVKRLRVKKRLSFLLLQARQSEG